MRYDGGHLSHVRKLRIDLKLSVGRQNKVANSYAQCSPFLTNAAQLSCIEHLFDVYSLFYFSRFLIRFGAA